MQEFRAISLIVINLLGTIIGYHSHMEHKYTLAAPAPMYSGTVTVLHCPEQISLDPIPLARIFAQKGEAEAEEMVCRALEDVAQRLDQLQDARADCAFHKIAKPARRIAAIATQIGLIEVALAAGHVAACAGSLDGVALGATMSRLERGFDSAVSQVWNFRDMG